jgi:hypothetical protein
MSFVHRSTSPDYRTQVRDLDLDLATLALVETLVNRDTIRYRPAGRDPPCNTRLRFINGSVTSSSNAMAGWLPYFETDQIGKWVNPWVDSGLSFFFEKCAG